MGTLSVTSIPPSTINSFQLPPPIRNPTFGTANDRISPSLTSFVEVVQSDATVDVLLVSASAAALVVKIKPNAMFRINFTFAKPPAQSMSAHSF